MTRVTVFGTGALGCWVAGRLSAFTEAALTVAGSWPEGLRAIARDGIVVQEPEHFFPLPQNPGRVLILFPQLFAGSLTVEPLHIKRRHGAAVV